MEYVIGFVVVMVVIGYFITKHEENTGQTKDKVLIRKYKTTSVMQHDMNKLTKNGWTVQSTTAAPGFVTGTRSYTVTYIRS